jgi:transposase
MPETRCQAPTSRCQLTNARPYQPRVLSTPGSSIEATRSGTPRPAGRGVRAPSQDPSSTKKTDLRRTRVSHDDVLFGYRLRDFTLAAEIGVRPACRQMGVHHSTYYRLKRRVDRWGLEALRIRERRRPRMPNQIGPHLEQRVIAFCLGHPGFGPRRISSELAREKWGGIRISEPGVWRVLCRYGLNTRSKRLALIARHRDPYERKPVCPPPERHIDASARARGYSSTASTSAGCRAPRERSGSTRLPTSPRASPGPNCTPQSATPGPGGPESLCTGWPAS